MLMSPDKEHASNFGPLYEQNMRAYASALASHGKGYVQDDGDVVLTIFPYTFWSNGVVSPCFGEGKAQKRIEEILAVFRSYKREVWIHIGPSSCPADLAQLLKVRGFWNFHNRPFMGCTLSTLISGYPSPEGITIQPISDYAIFYDYPHPIHGLVTSTRKKHIFSTFQKLDAQSPRQHWMFIADKNGEPIGVAILFIHDNVAGIYDVEVLREYRGQGIGTDLLQNVCIFARNAGARVAVLAASEQGSQFYPRFGFSIAGRYPTYYYSIKKQKQDAIRLDENW
jgi:GNAT superfamily N-acetyltransferase